MTNSQRDLAPEAAGCLSFELTPGCCTRLDQAPRAADRSAPFVIIPRALCCPNVIVRVESKSAMWCDGV